MHTIKQAIEYLEKQGLTSETKAIGGARIGSDSPVGLWRFPMRRFPGKRLSRARPGHGSRFLVDILSDLGI